MIAAWLGLLAAAFHVAAVPLLRAPASATEAPLGAIVVCTAAGMMTIGDGSAPAGRHAVICDLCLPFLHGFTGAQEASGPLNTHHQVTAVMRPTRNLLGRDLRASRVFGARAPPSA